MTETGQGLVVAGSWHLDFAHAAGRAATRFLTTLRDERRLTASPCPSCGRVRVPPRDYCEDCFVRTSDDWVGVGPEGTIEAFTITYMSFPDYPDPPHAIAYVQPDGASTAICNFVLGVDLEEPDVAASALTIGTRVRAVFADAPAGEITDFHWELLP